MNMFIIALSGFPRDKGADHAEDAFVHLGNGSLWSPFPDREIHLNAGDSAYSDGHVEHEITRRKRADAEFLIVIAQNLH